MKDAKGHGSDKRGLAHTERGQRYLQRYPVAPHAAVRSISTHPGAKVVELGRNGLRLVTGGRRTSVAEAIARGMRTDGRTVFVK
jgi:hypothetical protein